ncbi:hypothetical protein J6590_030847 [Homalodisca vitripennis]|nr:hypothetical protein J6590_030847 [Homalodisca vitripennis]
MWNRVCGGRRVRQAARNRPRPVDTTHDHTAGSHRLDERESGRAASWCYGCKIDRGFLAWQPIVMATESPLTPVNSNILKVRVRKSKLPLLNGALRAQNKVNVIHLSPVGCITELCVQDADGGGQPCARMLQDIVLIHRKKWTLTVSPFLARMRFHFARKRPFLSGRIAAIKLGKGQKSQNSSQPRL